MRYLIFILLLLPGCSKEDSPTESEQDDYASAYSYMVLVDGMVDENQLDRIGISNSEGLVEFDEKKYFPTFYEDPSFIRTDEMGNEMGELNLSDITDGLFNIILKNSEMNEILRIPNVTILDGVNTLNISLDGNYEVTHEEGDFNIQFLITNESAEPQENISVFLQYSCSPDWLAGEGCNNTSLVSRPSTTFEYALCSESDIQVLITLLDGSTVFEENYVSSAGSYTYSISSDIHQVDSFSILGLQVFKYSLIVDEGACSNCSNGRNSATIVNFGEDCYLGNVYPNPFN